jgi:hypothetical protein
LAWSEEVLLQILATRAFIVWSSVAALELFMNSFKDTYYASLAQLRIEELKKQQEAAPLAAQVEKADDEARATVGAERQRLAMSHRPIYFMGFGSTLDEGGSHPDTGEPVQIKWVIVAGFPIISLKTYIARKTGSRWSRSFFGFDALRHWLFRVPFVILMCLLVTWNDVLVVQNGFMQLLPVYSILRAPVARLGG